MLSSVLPSTILTKQYSIKAINTKTVQTDIKASTANGEIWIRKLVRIIFRITNLLNKKQAAN